MYNVHIIYIYIYTHYVCVYIYIYSCETIKQPTFQKLNKKPTSLQLHVLISCRFE